MSQLSLWPAPECVECGEPVVDPLLVDDISGITDGVAVLICKEHYDEFPGDFRRVD